MDDALLFRFEVLVLVFRRVPEELFVLDLEGGLP